MEKQKVVGSEMPLSWMWNEKDYDISEKLKEIENISGLDYEYGEASEHAGLINDSIIKEIERAHRIMEFDFVLEKLDSLIAQRDAERSNEEGKNGR